MSVWGKSKSNDTILTDSQLAHIRNVNKLDWELYEYAIKLFDERVSQLRRKRRIRRWRGTFSTAQEDEKEEEEAFSQIAVCLLYLLDLFRHPIIMIWNG